ncbi:unnamed protein product [Allacma fusca]|uniref:Uncharacterized protein n=1 Tax=Allacma fusca TaxID=39272 RepID=A0A8J2PH55_9HEXA|nr:unnamed protein product [Allacma fusca]
MLSFAKYLCILSICNLLLLHGILSAPAESDVSVLEEMKQHQCSQCWNGHRCVPCGSGLTNQCPQGLIWDGNHCVGSGAGIEK